MQAGVQAIDKCHIRRPRVGILVHRPLCFRALVACAVAGVLAATWVPLAPERLFDFDAANFALAVDYFQPALHQPQPPGYPLYVGLLKIIHWFVGDLSVTFLIVGLLGATASVLMLWILGERMFGRRVGIFAALLLMTNPIMWETGMTDQVRVYIAVISIGVAMAIWPGWEARLTLRRFAASCFLLGLLSGLRPEMLMSMAPLLVIAAVRSRIGVRRCFLGGLALCAGAAPWVTMLVTRVGGVGNFVEMMRAYSSREAGRGSLLFGASFGGALKMFSGALWWVSLGIASWIPAACLVPWGKARDDKKQSAGFLMAWFLPLFLFSIIVHIASSGHALGFIPVLCLAGGCVLSAVGNTRNRRVMNGCVLVALGLNVLFFFKPYSKGVKEASYKTVGVINGINETILDKIDPMSQRNPICLVSDSAWVPWRILEYYYPKNPLLYLPSPMAPVDASPPVWLVQKRQLVREIDPHAELILPSCGTIVWLVADAKSRQELVAVQDAEVERYFVAIRSRPGMQFRVGCYRFVTSTQPCQPPT